MLRVGGNKMGGKAKGSAHRVTEYQEYCPLREGSSSEVTEAGSMPLITSLREKSPFLSLIS